MVTFLSKCRRHLAWGGHTRGPGPARGTAGGTEPVAAEECSEAAPAPRWAEARV